MFLYYCSVIGIILVFRKQGTPLPENYETVISGRGAQPLAKYNCPTYVAVIDFSIASAQSSNKGHGLGLTIFSKKLHYIRVFFQYLSVAVQHS